MFVILFLGMYNANAGPAKGKRKYTLERLIGKEPKIDGNLFYAGNINRVLHFILFGQTAVLKV
jgi:hypothetical protein